MESIQSQMIHIDIDRVLEQEDICMRGNDNLKRLSNLPQTIQLGSDFHMMSYRITAECGSASQATSGFPCLWEACQ